MKKNIKLDFRKKVNNLELKIGDEIIREDLENRKEIVIEVGKKYFRSIYKENEDLINSNFYNQTFEDVGFEDLGRDFLWDKSSNFIHGFKKYNKILMGAHIN